MIMGSRKAFQLIKAGKVDLIDLRFIDVRGVWQHMTMMAREFTLSNYEKGFGFDGSSIKGFCEIEESDMLLKPDLSTLFLDPFFERTLVCICDVYDPVSGNAFERDPRYTAKKAEEYLKKSKVGTVSYWGPELEFFVFDSLHTHLSPYHSYIEIGSYEIPGHNSGGNLSPEKGDGYTMLAKSAYFPTPPFDKLQRYRSDMVRILESIGVSTEVHHHEVATGGQVEIDMRYDSLVKMADNVMKYKYVARNLAVRHGMHACFLPKPIFGDNGSGMHTHQSIFKGGKNVFYDSKGYAELSKTALAYTAGLLGNIEPLLGITNPTLNSYRRLVPHFEAPTSVAFSKRNRSAAVRIPMYFKGEEKAKRLEFRCPDPAGNPYLSFAAQLVYGLEGVKKNLNPEKLGFGPFDENIWHRKGAVKQTPNSLAETLEALKKDTTLARSGVFAESLLEAYINLKTDEMRTQLLYPNPADFWFSNDL